MREEWNNREVSKKDRKIGILKKVRDGWFCFLLTLIFLEKERTPFLSKKIYKYILYIKNFYN